MHTKCMPKIVSEIVTPGVTIQMVDYHWDAGAEILDCEPDLVLRWRLRPYRVKVRGWIQPGNESSFGQLMMLPAHVETYARASNESEDVRTVVCRFNREWLNSVTGHSSDWTGFDPESCLDFRNGNIDHAMRRLSSELAEPGLCNSALCESLSVSMSIDLARHFNAQGGSAKDYKGILSPGRLRHIREFINSFSNGSPTLADIASECGFSVAHLRRVFKNTTGQTLHDYIDEQRIARAQSLLMDPKLRLKSISYQLGFCHPSAFSTAFRRATGESPVDYRLRRTSAGLS